MKVEVDQSGKIEQTNRPTAIAFSNDVRGSIIISAKEKPLLQREFRRIGKPRAFVYQTFNAMVYRLLKDHVRRLEKVIIDREYPGKDSDLKNHLLAIFSKSGQSINQDKIYFREIGKTSRAHKLAYQTYKTRQATDRVAAKEILAILLA